MMSLQELATYGTFLFMGVSAISLVVNARRQKRTDDVSSAEKALRLERETNAAFERRIKELENQAKSNELKITALEAQTKEKDALIDRYVQLLQNRNPELELFMKNSTKYLETIAEGIKALLQKPTVSINNQPTK